jgi:hypothetical protein
MLHKPGHSIYEGVLTDSAAATDIVAWFDEIYERNVPPINNTLYRLTSFERCPDNVLDYFLFDKGFSTHVELSAEAKRCILRNWEFITKHRFTDASIKLYLECILEVSVTMVSTYGQRRQFLQANSTRFGFPNQASLDSLNTPNDLMVYIYSTEYSVLDTLEITLSSVNEYTALLTDYLFEVIKFELPSADYSNNLEITIKDDLGAIISVKTL